MRTIKLTLEYDGTLYHGWQLQPGLLTIQGVVQDRLTRMTQEPVRVIGAGRTDAGVHALGQVAHFRTTSTILLPALQRGLNSLLPPDVVVTAVEEVPDSFHARHSARSKVYVYVILNRPYPSALWRHYSWFIPQRLDLASMNTCGRTLIGNHDFTSFRASGDESPHSIRTVLSVEATPRTESDLILVTIEANAFLREMVRAIVGTLVSVGRGRISPEAFSDIVRVRDRRRAGVTAPARGLFLREVRY